MGKRKVYRYDEEDYPEGKIISSRGDHFSRLTPAQQKAQLEQARRNLALTMIGSFVALLVGACAGVAGSQWLPEDAARTTSFAEQRRS
jgi:hypothetical protein